MQTKKRKKMILVASLLLVTLVVGGVVFAFVNTQPKKNQSDDPTRPINSVDYSGPTQEESAAGDTQKENNKQREQTDAQPPASNANIVLTDATQYSLVIEVRAYVSNIYEDGGNCVATFTKAGFTPINVTSHAFKDAKTTQCGAMDIERNQFPSSGEWQVAVKYSSSSASGNSEKRKVNIQ